MTAHESRMHSLRPFSGRGTRQISKENHPMHVAYLDAASGSMIVQAVVAGVAGVAVFAKIFWRRLTTPFRREAESTPQTQATTHERVGAKDDER
jgi:hypothetical protein